MIRDAEASVSEAAGDLERFLDSVDVDPDQLDDLEARKAMYEDLRRKYDRTVEGLIELRDALADRMARQETAASDLEQLAEDLESARRKLGSAALALRKNRQNGAAKVAALAVETIRPLALPELELEFRIEEDLDESSDVAVARKRCRITGKGAERVSLLARTNRGEGMGEVAQIASGGEKSRIFLGLSVLLQRDVHGRLQLYDEIDAGLGMDNALPVAKLLERLAAESQVICITHLPTVAARGDHHLKVEKVVTGQRTVLRVSPIPGEARVQEIARLLGGRKAPSADGPDKQAAYARQLLGRG
jgi:DNA repair protein RecN (Recombination protein N)